MPLEGKRVLVTGAGSGIGRALALEAARRGMHVVLCGRRRAALEATLGMMEAGALHRVVTADITVPGERRLLVAAVSRHWPALDILVNNAGVVNAGAVGEASDAMLEQLFATNTLAPIALVRAFLPMLQVSASARVVNIGSVFGEIPYPGFAAYCASKAALKAFSTALRRELASQAIAVTHVAPRATDTDAASVLDKIEGGAPARLDTPQQVATAVWNGVALGRNTINAQGPERFYMLLQRLLPKVMDLALSTRKTPQKEDRHEAVN
jgi:short-subunit dehydrogenase